MPLRTACGLPSLIAFIVGRRAARRRSGGDVPFAGADTLLWRGMRVQLAVATAQPLVRAVQVEGASVEDAVAQLGAWDAAGLRVPAVILPVEPGELGTIADCLKG